MSSTLLARIAQRMMKDKGFYAAGGAAAGVRELYEEKIKNPIKKLRGKPEEEPNSFIELYRKAKEKKKNKEEAKNEVETILTRKK